MPQAHKLHGLYAITPDGLDSDTLYKKTQLLLSGGVRILQYRDKSQDHHKRKEQALTLKAMCQHHGVLFIVNDDVQLALDVAADGVHLGKDDDAVPHARSLLGPNAILGKSCYGTLENAHRAVEQGVDYIAFGSFFNSPTKPNAPTASVTLIEQAKQLYPTMPICGIGGITDENAHLLRQAGIDMMAVIPFFMLPKIQPQQHKH